MRKPVVVFQWRKTKPSMTDSWTLENWSCSCGLPGNDETRNAKPQCACKSRCKITCHEKDCGASLIQWRIEQIRIDSNDIVAERERRDGLRVAHDNKHVMIEIRSVENKSGSREFCCLHECCCPDVAEQSRSANTNGDRHAKVEMTSIRSERRPRMNWGISVSDDAFTIDLMTKCNMCVSWLWGREMLCSKIVKIEHWYVKTILRTHIVIMLSWFAQRRGPLVGQEDTITLLHCMLLMRWDSEWNSGADALCRKYPNGSTAASVFRRSRIVSFAEGSWDSLEGYTWPIIPWFDTDFALDVAEYLDQRFIIVTVSLEGW